MSGLGHISLHSHNEHVGLSKKKGAATPNLGRVISDTDGGGGTCTAVRCAPKGDQGAKIMRLTHIGFADIIGS